MAPTMCDQVRPLLSDMLDGDLTPDRAAMVTDHIASCLSCQSRLHALNHMSAMFKASDLALPPPGFTARVMSRLQDREAAARASAPPTLAWSAAAAMMLAAIAVAVMALGLASGAGVGGSLSPEPGNLVGQIGGAALHSVAVMMASVDAAIVLSRHVPPVLLIAVLLWLFAGTLAVALMLASLLTTRRPSAGAVLEVSGEH